MKKCGNNVRKSGQKPTFKNKSGHEKSPKFRGFAAFLPTYPLFFKIFSKKVNYYIYVINAKNKRIGEKKWAFGQNYREERIL
jgi:hypothetical protein